MQLLPLQLRFEIRTYIYKYIYTHTCVHKDTLCCLLTGLFYRNLFISWNEKQDPKQWKERTRHRSWEEYHAAPVLMQKAGGWVPSSDKRLQKNNKPTCTCVPWINDTYFQDGPVCEDGLSVPMLLSLTKRKMVTMNVSQADTAILKCPPSKGRERLAGLCAVNCRDKCSDE